MKTYSEVKGNEPFDWFKALNKDCHQMTWKEAKDMIKKSSSWVTCACGNQCAIIPREQTLGEPLDFKLKELGTDFNDYIQSMRFDIENYQEYLERSDWKQEAKNSISSANRSRKKAITTLKKIEARSAILIQKELKTYKQNLANLGLKMVSIKKTKPN